MKVDLRVSASGDLAIASKTCDEKAQYIVEEIWEEDERRKCCFLGLTIHWLAPTASVNCLSSGFLTIL